MPGTSLLLMVSCVLYRSPNWLVPPTTCFLSHQLGSSFSPNVLWFHTKKSHGLQITHVESGNVQGIICERISFPFLLAWWFDETFNKKSTLKKWGSERFWYQDPNENLHPSIWSHFTSAKASIRAASALIDRFPFKNWRVDTQRSWDLETETPANISWCIFVKFHQVYCISILLKVMWGTSQTCTCKCQRSKT